MMNLTPEIVHDHTEHALIGVHPDLVRVVRRFLSATKISCGVFEGLRTIAQELVHMHSHPPTSWLKDPRNCRHCPTGNPPLGHAVDIVPVVNGQWKWDDAIAKQMVPEMKAAAAAEKVTLRYGITFGDLVHYELNKSAYP